MGTKFAGVAESVYALGLNPGLCRFDPCRPHHSCALSSEAERGSYKAQVGISKFSARTISFRSSMAEHSADNRKTADRYRAEGPRTRSLQPEWRGSGLLTRRQVDRNHTRSPAGPIAEWLSGGLLTRVKVGSIPTRFTMGLYPNRQRERFERPYSVRSSRTRRTRSKCAVRHQVRPPACHVGETGSFPVQRANSTACSSVW
jgi:hypothetical protein